jgi:hypothetical protein
VQAVATRQRVRQQQQQQCRQSQLCRRLGCAIASQPAAVRLSTRTLQQQWRGSLKLSHCQAMRTPSSRRQQPHRSALGCTNSTTSSSSNMQAALLVVPQGYQVVCSSSSGGVRPPTGCLTSRMAQQGQQQQRRRRRLWLCSRRPAL